MTARERAMMRTLRELVADDDGALEVIDALDSETLAYIEALADMTALHNNE